MTFAYPTRLIQSVLSLALGLSLVMAAASADAQNREKKDPYLSKEDIALIKVYEVDLGTDPPPTVKIPRDELRKFLKEFQSDDRVPRGKQAQDRWLRSDGHKQLSLLFQLKARDYYKHVRISSKIESLHTFRNIHRRYILGYFQPAFGSGAIESLYLFPRGRDAERIEMTNYYILTQATVDGKPIIDRNAPEESLLVQWGLPRDEAKFPAPEIDGWVPKFKGTKDERFIEHVDWIKSLVPANQGSTLGVEFKMPQHKKPQN
ncbi:MAG: hypothetical protein KTR15_01585 [Phycisphaeraceae bacterium]|nr:hypothetical protein [Phycisphaeraceae bacterium]